MMIIYKFLIIISEIMFSEVNESTPEQPEKN